MRSRSTVVAGDQPSLEQMAIWYEHLLLPEASNSGYFSATISGELSEEDIGRACARVVDRHPPLRTLIRVVDERPRLDVRPPGVPLAFAVVDMPCAPGAERAAARAWRESHGKRRWDLGADPEIYFSLLRHDGQRRTLLVVVHHMNFDGGSKFIFARDFAAALTELRDGAAERPAPAPPPPGQWVVPEPVVGAARGYWDRLAKPGLHPLRLPVTGEPAASGVGTTGTVEMAGPAEVRSLAGFCAEAGATFFGGLLAALATHLHGYGNRRVVLSVPADTRTAEQADSIGLAINTVPLQVAAHADDTFRTVVESARASLDRLREFRRVPLASILHRQPWAAGFRALIGQFGISYLRLPDRLPTVAGLTIEWDMLAPNTAQTFNLMLHMRRSGDRVLARMDYRQATVDGPAMDEFMARYAGVLRRAVADPDRPVRELAAPPRPPSTRRRPAPVPDRQAWLRRHVGDVPIIELAGRSAADLPAQLGDRRPHAVATVRTALPALVAALRAGALGGRLAHVIVPLPQLRDEPCVRELRRLGVTVWGRYDVAGAGLVGLGTPSGCAPVPGVSMRIVGEDGQILPTGVAGELVVEADVRSGDLVRVDSGGDLHYLGRLADLAHWAGLTVNAYALEQRICGYPDVHDVAVLVRAGPQGIAARAYVAGTDLSVARLRLLLRRDLGRDAVVPGVELVDEVPRTPAGDIDRAALPDLGRE